MWIVQSIIGNRPNFNVLTFARHGFKLITAKLLQYATRQAVGFKQLWRSLVILNKSDKMKTPTVLPTADYWILFILETQERWALYSVEVRFIKTKPLFITLWTAACLYVTICNL